MEEIYLQALVNRAKDDITFIDKLPDDVKQLVNNLIAELEAKQKEYLETIENEQL